MDYGVESSEEGFVHVGFEIGGQDDQAVEFLHSLEEVGYFLVGVAVVGVFDVGALAE